jgi:hypothetical protein
MGSMSCEIPPIRNGHHRGAGAGVVRGGKTVYFGALVSCGFPFLHTGDSICCFFSILLSNLFFA